MVTIKHRTPEQLRNLVDSMLPSLLSAWQELPAVLQKIDQWDDGEAMDYIEELRHLEAERLELQVIASHGVLTPEQHRQYDRLREMSAEYQPEVDRLLGVAS